MDGLVRHDLSITQIHRPSLKLDFVHSGGVRQGVEHPAE